MAALLCVKRRSGSQGACMERACALRLSCLGWRISERAQSQWVRRTNVTSRRIAFEDVVWRVSRPRSRPSHAQRRSHRHAPMDEMTAATIVRERWQVVAARRVVASAVAAQVHGDSVVPVTRERRS